MNDSIKSADNLVGSSPYPKGVFIHGCVGPNLTNAHHAKSKALTEQLKQRAKGVVDMLLEHVDKAASTGEMMVRVMVEKEQVATGEIDTAGLLVVERNAILRELINRGFQGTIFLHDTRVEVNIYW
jgi:hypothetical protein